MAELKSALLDLFVLLTGRKLPNFLALAVFSGIIALKNKNTKRSSPNPKKKWSFFNFPNECKREYSCMDQILVSATFDSAYQIYSHPVNPIT